MRLFPLSLLPWTAKRSRAFPGVLWQARWPLTATLTLLLCLYRFQHGPAPWPASAAIEENETFACALGVVRCASIQGARIFFNRFLPPLP